MILELGGTTIKGRRVHQNLKIFAKKILRNFGTDIMKKLRKSQYWAKTSFL